MLLLPVPDGEVEALVYSQQKNQKCLEAKNYVVSEEKIGGEKTTYNIGPKPLNSQNKYKRFYKNISTLF